MSPLEIGLAISGGVLGYAAIAFLLKGFLYPLTKWPAEGEVFFALLWPVSWVFLTRYLGLRLGKKVRVWHDEREADQKERERIRVSEERKQRIEIEKIEREMEEEETLFRNEQSNSRGITIGKRR